MMIAALYSSSFTIIFLVRHHIIDFHISYFSISNAVFTSPYMEFFLALSKQLLSDGHKKDFFYEVSV